MWVQHFDDGTSELAAVLPTLTAEAIRNRLRAVAVSPTQPVPHQPALIDEVTGLPAVHRADTRESGDPRTLAQREADLLAAWLLSGRTVGQTPTDAQVGVIVPLHALTSGTQAPGMLRDRSASVPAEQIRALVDHPDTTVSWQEMRVRSESAAPVQGTEDDSFDVLSHIYRGRFVPPVLREALSFRDGTCRAPGCTVSADRCDVDHREPWPHGETTGANLQMLCRGHHRLKSHGMLAEPSLGTPSPPGPAAVTRSRSDGAPRSPD